MQKHSLFTVCTKIAVFLFVAFSNVIYEIQYIQYIRTIINTYLHTKTLVLGARPCYILGEKSRFICYFMCKIWPNLKIMFLYRVFGKSGKHGRTLARSYVSARRARYHYTKEDRLIFSYRSAFIFYVKFWQKPILCDFQ